MNCYNINDSYILEGKWFFPNKNFNLFFGQLVYDLQATNPILNFWSEVKSNLNDLKNNSIFWGFFSDGISVTLFDVHFKSSKFSVSSNGFSSYSCNILGSIIIRKPYPSSKEINCKKVISNLSGLEYLISKNHFDSYIKEKLIQFKHPYP